MPWLAPAARGWIVRANGHFDLTDQGRQAALSVLAR